MKTIGRSLIITAETEHVPRWIRVRDLILTIMLWLGCGGMWVQLFPEIKSWFAAHQSEDLIYELPSILGLLRDGTLMTLGLLCVYFIWSVRTYLTTNRHIALPAPRHLPLEEEAGAYGIKPEEIPALREHASVTVLAGKDGHIVSWQPGFTPKKPE